MIAIIVAGVIAVYLGIRWYENRKAAQEGNTQGGAGLGSNLNSVAPELIGGSTGPSIGPALSTPITINVTSPMPDTSLGANPVGSMVSSNNVVPSALALANPDNSATGAQDAAPVPEDASGGGIDSAATGPTWSTPMSAAANQPNSTGITRGIPTAPAERPPPRPHEPGPGKPVRRPGAPRHPEPKGRPRRPAKR